MESAANRLPQQPSQASADWSHQELSATKNPLSRFSRVTCSRILITSATTIAGRYLFPPPAKARIALGKKSTALSAIRPSVSQLQKTPSSKALTGGGAATLKG